MCGHTRDPIIYSEFHRNPFRGFGAPGRVKIWPFPLLWLVAFTTACTTVQAVVQRFRQISGHSASTVIAGRKVQLALIGRRPRAFQ